MPAGHYFNVGAIQPASGNLQLPAITAIEAKSLDDKLDDGNPSTGRMIGRPSTSTSWPGCTAVGNTYNTTLDGNNCGVMIRISDGAF